MRNLSILICIIGCAIAQKPVYAPVKILVGESNNALDGTQPNVAITSYDAVPGHQWLLISNDDGTVCLRNCRTGKAIDLTDGNCRENSPITTSNYTASNNQKLYLNGDKTISPYCNNNFKFGISNPGLILVPMASTTSSTFKVSYIHG